MDRDYFTPFGARVTPPPVIVLPRRPGKLYRAVACAGPLLWAAAVLLTLHLIYATAAAVVDLDRQIEMAERV